MSSADKSANGSLKNIMISIISAVAKNGVIGNKNKLPWHMPADFKWFKEKTLGKTIIMGLNTFKSIGEKPLPNRKHIILNNDPNFKAPGDCLIANSIEQVLELARGEEEIIICGGALVYKQFLPIAERLYLTYIHENFEGDAYFPEFDINEWQETFREDHQSDEKNKHNYSFVILERNEN